MVTVFFSFVLFWRISKSDQEGYAYQDLRFLILCKHCVAHSIIFSIGQNASDLCYMSGMQKTVDPILMYSEERPFFNLPSE